MPQLYNNYIIWQTPDCSSLNKEQEDTRSYISIPASPRANEAQIIPAERAGEVQQVKKAKQSDLSTSKQGQVISRT